MINLKIMSDEMLSFSSHAQLVKQYFQSVEGFTMPFSLTEVGVPP